MGVDPIASTSTAVWGFESNYGCFAQFSAVEDYQCFQKPDNITFEQGACAFVSFATAYRQLTGWYPHVVRPGDPILIWGGAGGLGSAAIQITRAYGGVPIAVVSSKEKADYCMSLGAKATIDRRDFGHWGRMPVVGGEGFEEWQAGVRKFGKAFWEALGERRNPWIVFEHSGQDTMPTSIFICDNGGMIVTCGATSGYNLDIDARVLWMRLKRLQGSHFASLRQCRDVVTMFGQGSLDPLLARTWGFDEIGPAHQMMHDNAHPPGNMAALINAPEPGLKRLPL
jgi:crotonyl-CoA carboxylase/reductase